MAGLFSGRSDAIEDETKEDEEAQLERNKAKQRESESVKHSIKSRKAFQMALSDQAMPPSIIRLNRVTNILIIFLIVLAIVDYSSVYKQLQDTITNYEVIESSQRQISEIQKVAYNVRTLILLNQGSLTNYQG